MTRFVLDTNALGDWAAKRRGVDVRARQALATGHPLGSIAEAVAELLGGLEFSASADRNRPGVERVLAQLTLWPFGLPAARLYGRLYAVLRRRGDQIQPVDLMLAAVALTVKDCVVVSSDGDLRRVPGLRVEDWTDPPPPA